MVKVLIQDQIGSVLEVIESHGKTINFDHLDAVVQTLTYLKDHRAEIQLAAMIHKDPAVKALLEAFPGAEVRAIRPITQED